MIVPPAVPAAPHPRPSLVADLHLDALCFEVQDLDDRPGPIRSFLLGFVGEELPTLELVYRYLDVVLPQGLPGTLLVSNAGDDPQEPEWRRALLFRPLPEGPLAEYFGRGGYTLGMSACRRQGRLVIRHFEVTPHVLRRDFEARVSAVIYWNDPDRYMSPEDLQRLGGLPYHRAVTSRRLHTWQSYLNWKERLIRENQVSVPYLAWRWESQDRIAFLVDAGALPKDKCRPGLELGAAPPPPDPDLVEERGGRWPLREPKLTDLGEIDSIHPIDPRHSKDTMDWGKIQPTGEHRRVIVRLDEDDAAALHKRELPSRGLLMSSIAGDLAPLVNQRRGIERLKNSQGFCPRLADFIFDARGASVPMSAPDELPLVRGGRELNLGQRDAVNKAMSAPDICLIQGPPGTGKTTVIADICLRAANMGKRVLVASQTNLAVDNALARLADTPAVRRLRLGDPGKVDEEFKDFLAENVISRWFSSIAEQCRHRLDASSRDEQEAARRAEALSALRGLAREHNDAVRFAAERAAAHQASLQALTQTHTALARHVTAQETSAAHVAIWSQLQRWLTDEGELPRDLSQIAGDLDVDRLRSVATAITKQPDVVALVGTLSALRDTAAGPSGTDELTRLRAEKRKLTDAEDDDDLRRLGEVNRRIKVLEQSGWSRATGAVGRAAAAVYGDAVPPDLILIADSLRPGDEVHAAVERVQAEVDRLRVAGEAALRERSSLQSVVESALVASRENLRKHEAALQTARASHERAQREAESSREAAHQMVATVTSLVRRWSESWTALLGDDAPDPSLSAVADAARQIAEQAAQSEARRARATRWRAVQAEWLDRLGNISGSDRDQLQTLYVRQANVVGMTCNEAGKRQTWQDKDFKPFDIVIIDEVSKATPPELILPMLLGYRVVLVGDHRQLPPMFRERDASFGEAAESGQISKEDFATYRRMVTASLFEELFEAAHDSIKATLWLQYRMHPHIMDVVNQFYDGRLEAGPDRETLAKRRPHHLRIPDKQGGLLLEPQQHLLWVDSSTGPDGKPHFEEQVGSGKRNELEVGLVVRTVVRVGRALVARGYTGEVELPLESSDEGRPLRALVAERLPEMPPETLDELFDERRVRVDGRAQRPDRAARGGETLVINARREVGILTFYGAQLKAIRQTLDMARHDCPDAFVGMDLRTNTVDRFQGMEKPIIIASLVRSKRGKLGDFVREYQRINVGLSRAQQLLIIVGAADTWKSASVPLPPIDGGPPEDRPVYAEILDHARRSGGRRVVRQLIT